MRHSLCISPDGKQVLSATFQPDSNSDSQFLSRLHKAFLFGDQVAFHAEGDEFRTVFNLPPGCEQTSIEYDQPLPEPIENSVEVVKSNFSKPRISSEPAVKFPKPSLISIVYQCLSFIAMCGFVGWCLASLLWWLLCSI